MKKTTIFLLLLISQFTLAQTLNIPDAGFKTKLINASPSNTIAKNLSGAYFKIDANNDGEIQLSEALQVKELLITNSFITSFEGILNFVNIEKIDFSANFNLSTLNVSGLLALKYLKVTGVYTLSYLNFANCINLEELNCNIQNLPNLDVSGLVNLKKLSCGYDHLTSLNLTNNVNLIELNCYGNQLQTIDLRNGNNSNMISVNITNNPSLTCIYVDNVSNPVLNTWLKDTYFGTYVSNETQCASLSTDIFSSFDNTFLYPNPAKGIITLKSTNIYEKAEIYDVCGRFIQNLTIVDNTINVSSFEKSVYFLKLYTYGNNNVSSFKIIKD